MLTIREHVNGWTRRVIDGRDTESGVSERGSAVHCKETGERERERDETRWKDLTRHRHRHRQRELQELQEGELRDRASRHRERDRIARASRERETASRETHLVIGDVLNLLVLPLRDMGAVNEHGLDALFEVGASEHGLRSGELHRQSVSDAHGAAAAEQLKRHLHTETEREGHRQRRDTQTEVEDDMLGHRGCQERERERERESERVPEGRDLAQLFERGSGPVAVFLFQPSDDLSQPQTVSNRHARE